MRIRQVTALEHRLGCAVEGLTYDFERMEGALHLARNHCCDMTACINLFKRIDPRVQFIQTFAAGVMDTKYRLRSSGEWVAALAADAHRLGRAAKPWQVKVVAERKAERAEKEEGPNA